MASMKRIIILIFIMMIAAGIFAQNGTVRELTGTVEIKRPGDSGFTAAGAGEVISRDTIISTGFKSTALVEVGSAVISVRPLTRLTLTEIAAASGVETLNVNLQAGRVRVDVTPPAGTRNTTTITSPVATASVRGTSFEFDTRKISVSHGSVSFAGNRGKAMQVNAGAESRVEPDGKPADPVKMKSARLRPPPPVGADSSSGTGGESVAGSGGSLTVVIDYMDDF